MSRSRGSEEAKGRDDVAGASCTGWSTRLGQESLSGAEHGSVDLDREDGGIEHNDGDISAKVAASFDGDVDAGEGRRKKKTPLSCDGRPDSGKGLGHIGLDCQVHGIKGLNLGPSNSESDLGRLSLKNECRGLSPFWEVGQPNHVVEKAMGLDWVGCVGSLKKGKASRSVLYSKPWGMEEELFGGEGLAAVEGTSVNVFSVDTCLVEEASRYLSLSSNARCALGR